LVYWWPAILLYGKRTPTSHGVSSLYGNRQTLLQVYMFFLLPCHQCQTTTNSFTNSEHWTPQEPNVSNAKGMKVWMIERSEYLLVLLDSALTAAEPATIDESATWEGAKVSTTVTSQAKQRPRPYGIKVTPSGRLPSDLHRPLGSNSWDLCPLKWSAEKVV